MAFGFGFNKAKVLSSAEKYVQQGKLHHAITEYEKIVEKEPKDLTVLNTIGDLYARLGQTDKAGEYFRRVGDTYATEGFTVKAIAMYKKLTKLNPGSVPVVQRLAELYTQQGLYNDARQQYLQLADACIKTGDLNGAVKIFQKMLELDPDNVALQLKLVDLYVKIGKKTEARDVLMRSATALYERGSTQQADEALNRMLALDPANVEALFMRGKIALEAGDGAGAAHFLERVPNIDSRVDGLQALMRAYIAAGDSENASSTARKLASVHNDLSGIRAYADYLIGIGQSDAALDLYNEFVERLMANDTGELTFALQGLTGQVKDNPKSLEKLRMIFQKAGATANIPEVNELLAHAYVQTGELVKARDLYKELADLEPTNQQHMQNYRQVMVRLGEDSTARPLAPVEGAQAFFVEEIQQGAAPFQEYPAPLMEKISNVLTDAELFESYNKHANAIGPLEAVLAQAPEDIRLNQRLISVYTRVGKLEEAARCCDTLKAVYLRENLPGDARKYGDMAVRYREQSGIPAVAEAPVLAPEAPVAPAEDLTEQVFGHRSEAPAAPAGDGEAHEIDLSSEWEAAVAEPAPEEIPVVAPQPFVKDEPAVEEISFPSDFGVEAPADEFAVTDVSDLLEEIKFYISQQMWDEARAAIAKCEKAAPASMELAELKEQLAQGGSVAEPQPEVEEVAAFEVDLDSAPLAAEPLAPEAVAEEASVAEFNFETSTVEPAVAEPVAEEASFEVTPSESAAQEFTSEQPAPAEFAIAPAAEEIPAAEVAAVPEEVPVAEVAAPEPAPAFEEPAPVAEVAPPAPVAEPEPVAAAPVVEEAPIPEEILAPQSAAASTDVLADMVLDLESALGDDFGQPAAKAAPGLEPAPEPAPVAKAEPIPAPQLEPTIAVAAAASASGTPAPAQPEIAASAAAAPAAAPAMFVATPVAPAEVGGVSDTSLSDLFEEFKEEVGDTSEEVEDPETHYNLGVAFKEMGLLDEAIGELQKVCKAIDHGVDFSQQMQAYTWLANCFVEKGVPEASVKWYQKALTIVANDESRTALHYDLASAYELAGDKANALKHFTEVYGTNIDYRDVAERIKALKS